MNFIGIQIFITIFIGFSNACPTNKILSGHTNMITSFVNLINGNIATGSLDSNIIIWDPYNGQMVKKISLKQKIHQLIQLKNGHLASGLENGEIQIWDPNTTKLIKTLNSKENAPISNLFLIKDNILASSTSAGSIKLWNIEKGVLIRTINEINTKYLHLLGENQLATVSSFNKSKSKINIWNTENGVLLKTITLEENINLALYLNNGLLAIISDSPIIKLLDYNTGKLVSNLTGHFGIINQLYNIDNEKLASVSTDKMIKVWNYKNRTLIKTLYGDDHISKVQPLTDGYVAALSLDNKLSVWEIKTADLIKEVEKINAYNLHRIKDFYLAVLNHNKYDIAVFDYTAQNCLESPFSKVGAFEYLLQTIGVAFVSVYQIITGKI